MTTVPPGEQYGNVQISAVSGDLPPDPPAAPPPTAYIESEGFLTLAQVRALVPLSGSTIYRKIKQGRFPAFTKVGGRSFWLKHSVLGFMADPAGWKVGAF